MSEENKAIVRREIEELFNHTGNLDVAEEIYAPDFVGHDPTMPEDLQGMEAARQFAEGMRSAFPDLTCTIEDQVAEGEKVVSRYTVRGTHQGEEFFGVPASGKRLEMRGIQIDRFEGGKLVEERAEFDLLGALQQLGAVPETGQAQGA